MKLIILLSLLGALKCVNGAPITQATLDNMAADCHVKPNQVEKCGVDCIGGFSRNCELDGGAGSKQMTATVTFHGVEEVEGECCYTYGIVPDADTTCDASSSTAELSHFMIDHVCLNDVKNLELCVDDPRVGKEEFTFVGDACEGGKLEGGFGNDGSTCYTGIKWDYEFGEVVDGTQFRYRVCLEYEGFVTGQCLTTTSWFQIKAGGSFDFEEITVPECPEAEPCPTLSAHAPPMNLFEPKYDPSAIVSGSSIVDMITIPLSTYNGIYWLLVIQAVCGLLFVVKKFVFSLTNSKSTVSQFLNVKQMDEEEDIIA